MVAVLDFCATEDLIVFSDRLVPWFAHQTPQTLLLRQNRPEILDFLNKKLTHSAMLWEPGCESFWTHHKSTRFGLNTLHPLPFQLTSVTGLFIPELDPEFNNIIVGFLENKRNFVSTNTLMAIKVRVFIVTLLGQEICEKPAEIRLQITPQDLIVTSDLTVISRACISKFTFCTNFFVVSIDFESLAIRRGREISGFQI